MLPPMTKGVGRKRVSHTLGIWYRRMRCVEELALEPGTDILSHTVVWPPASWVKVNIRDDKQTVPSTGPESILIVFLMLPEWSHCHSEVPGTTQLTIGDPLQTHGLWPGSLFFKVICHWINMANIEQLNLLASGLRKMEGTGLLGLFGSSGPRAPSWHLLWVVGMEPLPEVRWALALCPLWVLSSAHHGVLEQKWHFNNLLLGSLWLNTNHVSSFRYFPVLVGRETF